MRGDDKTTRALGEKAAKGSDQCFGLFRIGPPARFVNDAKTVLLLLARHFIAQPDDLGGKRGQALLGGVKMIGAIADGIK